MKKKELSAQAVSKDGTSPYKDICKRIRNLRTEKGMSQPEFAKSLGIKRPNLNNIERAHQAPSIDVMRAIKKKYKKSYDWLIDGK